ncbi:MAG: glycosyltransferase family 4 protein, partial [Capnocytophaga sp.]|nr:glycosyltransferase family 4 protein [Capnocytophaga sp.]
MKIIFLEAVQDHGGAQKSTIELAKRLKLLGHQVLIVDFWGSCQSFIDAVNTTNLNLQIINPRETPFLIHNKSKLKHLSNAISYFFLEKQYKRSFSKIVSNFQPDIVSVNNPKCLNILDSKASYTIDFFARVWYDYRSLSIITKKTLKKYKKILYLTVSQSTRQAIYSGGLTKLQNINVLNTVIETKTFNEYQPNYHSFDSKTPINILFSGGFLKSKGQHVCIAVAKKLKNLNIPFKMRLTGIIYKGDSSNKYYQSIRNFIVDNKLEKDIEIILDPPNIMDYFKVCDILIHPSSTEGLPRVCLEALSFGKPVIANPVGGVTDVVIHNLTGFITDFNDINQYVEYITKYIEDPNLYKLHSATARQLIQ